LYFAGTALGQWIASAESWRLHAARRFTRAGAGLLACGFALRLSRGWLEHLPVHVKTTLLPLTTAHNKSPPSLAYFAVHGGAALLALGLLFRARRAGSSDADGSPRSVVDPCRPS
jgi:hypothetical protein